MKCEIRVKIKRVFQKYKFNKIDENLKKKANDHFNLQISFRQITMMTMII